MCMYLKCPGYVPALMLILSAFYTEPMTMLHILWHLNFRVVQLVSCRCAELTLTLTLLGLTGEEGCRCALDLWLREVKPFEPMDLPLTFLIGGKPLREVADVGETRIEIVGIGKLDENSKSHYGYRHCVMTL